MKTKAITHRLVAAGVAAVVAVVLLAWFAVPASAAAPGWKILGITGPTNLEPYENDRQTVTVTGTAGMFNLTYEGDTTSDIPAGASAQTVEDELNDLDSISTGGGSVTVTRYRQSQAGALGADLFQYVVAFDGGALAGNSVSMLSAANGTPAPSGLSVSLTESSTLVVYPANVGGAATNDTITLTIGPLPAGIETAGPAGGLTWSCPGSAAGQSTVTCTRTEPLGDLRRARPVSVPLQTKADAPSSSSVEVSVSGGGAANGASYRVPLNVTWEKSKPGIAAMWAGAFDADGQPYTQAGGHPHSAATMFVVKTIYSSNRLVVPVGDSKDIVTDLPPGFIGNPMATNMRCPALEVGCQGKSSFADKAQAVVGRLNPLLRSFPAAGEEVQPPDGEQVTNDVPPHGYPAHFTFPLLSARNVLVASLRPEDYGVRVVAPNLQLDIRFHGSFVALYGEPEVANGKAFLTNPTACSGGVLTTWMNQSVWQVPGEVSDPFGGDSPPVTDCGLVPFEPDAVIDPTVGAVGSPSGLSARISLPQEGLTDPGQLATSHLRRTVVRFPEGVSVNPSAADGLAGCSDAEIALGTDKPVGCPDASKIGSVKVSTPLLDEELAGTLYLGSQESADPLSGDMYRLFLVIDSRRFGIRVKLAGSTVADPVTGRLTVTFDNNPQIPFDDLEVAVKGGPRAPLVLPSSCGTFEIETELTGWSGKTETVKSSFEVSGDGNGAPCPSRGLTPGFAAGVADAVAAGSSPFALRVVRPEADQELRSIGPVVMPEGLLGRVASVDLCAAGAADRGVCPVSSKIGHVQAAVGGGPNPLWVPQAGRAETGVYLTGPYKQAPYGLSIVVPAQAGPFDLGQVVVRSALNIDERTAQITAGVDESRLIDPDGTVDEVLPGDLPRLLKGVVLNQREIRLILDRPGFMLNPTDCTAQQITAEIGGYGGAKATVSSRFQAKGCAALGFKPRFRAQILDKGRKSTLRSFHPRTRFAVVPRPGDANIGGARVALPSSTILDQGNIGTTCTRAQMAARSCPARSVVGHAKAWSPLLRNTVEGPVYLAANGGARPLPDLVAVLDGEVRIVLLGEVSTLRAGGRSRLQNTFRVVPDAPVERFELTMRGGKNRGLLVNSTDLCRSRERGIAAFTGQNNRQHRIAFRLTPTFKGCAKIRRQAARRATARKKAIRNKARQASVNLTRSR